MAALNVQQHKPRRSVHGQSQATLLAAGKATLMKWLTSAHARPVAWSSHLLLSNLLKLLL